MKYKRNLFILSLSVTLFFITISCSNLRVKDVQFLVRADIEKYLFNISKEPDSTLAAILKNVSSEVNYNKDNYVDLLTNVFNDNKIHLQKYFGIVKSGKDKDILNDDNKIIGWLKDSIDLLVKRDIEVINKRVETFGVKSYNVSQEGKYGIKINASTEGNIDELKQSILIKGNLEFKLEIEQTKAMYVMQRMDSVLAESKHSHYKITDEMDTSLFKELHPWFYLVNFYQYQDGSVNYYSKELDVEDVNNILMRKEIKKVIPDNICFCWDYKPEKFTDMIDSITRFYALNKQPILTGDCIIHTTSSIDENKMPVVAFEMNAGGADKWAKITEENVNKRVAIILDDKVVSSPVIRSKITGGRCEITGISKESEAIGIAVALKAGFLPMPLILVSQN